MNGEQAHVEIDACAAARCCLLCHYLSPYIIEPASVIPEPVDFFFLYKKLNIILASGA